MALQIWIMWVFWGLLSAVLLGLYDISRKIALKNNAVIPVLFLACVTGALVFASVIILSYKGILTQNDILFVPRIDMNQHILFLCKSILVGSSWFFAYHAISKLPLTIVIPIRSTGPMWTLTGALIIYSERFSLLQWLGIIIVLIFFYMFSLAGKKEGINFKKNKWIYAIVIATLLGAASSLYDKYLISRFDRIAVQAWFSIYLVPVFAPFLIISVKTKKIKLFRWSWSIHMIGILLILADFFYFYALSDSEAKIALLSVLRRSSVIISFILGAIIFKEQNLRKKGIALIGILAGVVLIILSTI